MPTPSFQKNDELTQLFRAKFDDRNAEIGARLGEGLYSVIFQAKVYGQRKQVRLFKLLGPNDQLERKKENIQREIRILNALDEAGVSEHIRKVTGARFRSIEQTGPRENGQLTFWKAEPLRYGGHTFVAFQISDVIPGQSLEKVTSQRVDDNFTRNAGEHLGIILAEFHFHARKATFPHYTTEQELGGYDHAYRMVRDARDRSEKNASIDTAHQAHHALAQRLYADVMPIFKEGAREVVGTHGDLGLGNIIVRPEEDVRKIAGIVDWDKARKGPAEYDFLGVTVIPDLFKAATSAYIGRMSRLAEKPVTIDRGLALKLALAERTNRANLPMESMAQLTGGENISAGEVKARSIVAMAIILDQLKRIDPAYVEHAKAIEPQSLAAREKYRGIHLRVA